MISLVITALIAAFVAFTIGYFVVGRSPTSRVQTIGPDALWAAYHRRRRNGSWVAPRPDPLRVSRPGARLEAASAGKGPARDVRGSGEDDTGGRR